MVFIFTEINEFAMKVQHKGFSTSFFHKHYVIRKSNHYMVIYIDVGSK